MVNHKKWKMAFKSPLTASSVPEAPDKLFRELTRRKFPDVLPHQAATMQAYAGKAVGTPDVALQLPTGSGKTLVGLLIAEWRRRKFKERVVYFCPTKQLAYQVAEQANEKYGLSVATFVGRQRDFSHADRTGYLQAEKVAITTYSSLFNTNPFFDQADVIFVDDVHASENHIASLCAGASLRRAILAAYFRHSLTALSRSATWIGVGLPDFIFQTV